MFRPTKTTTMDIPADMEDQVRRYIEMLSLGGGASESKEPESSIISHMGFEAEEAGEVAEIDCVCGHNFCEKTGKWNFLIRFLDGSEEWVADENCQCEWSISEYLDMQGIKSIYLICRVSTEKQAEGTPTLDAQESLLHDEVRRRFGRFDSKSIRVKIVKIKRSAYKGIPGEMLSIFEAAKKGDYIMSSRHDRFSRNIEIASWLTDLTSKGVTVVANGAKYADDKEAFLMEILRGQAESATIGKRIKGVNEFKLQRGDDSIGSLPYGWTRQLRLDGSLATVAHEGEVEIITYIKTNRRFGFDAVAERLNGFGKYKRGRKWTASMVRNVIKKA